MARREATPALSVQRASPAANSLDIGLSFKQASHQRSPPHTPPSHISRAAKGKARAKVPRRPAVRDTFSSSNDARGGGNEHHRIGSDSHDLSWSPRQARDSIVDNMVQSLGQMSIGNSPPKRGPAPVYPAVDEPSPYSIRPYKMSRGRGHTFSSSLSEFDLKTPDNSAYYPSHSSQGHRSNSNSTLQSTTRKTDNIHAEEETLEGIKEKSYGTQRAPGPGERAPASRSSRRKGSKGSGSSSVDLGHMVGGPRRRPAIDRRSSSFDQGYENPGDITSSLSTVPRTPSAPSVMSRSLIHDYDDFEAAPTPTVPVGPRRNRSPQPNTVIPSHASHTTPKTLPIRGKTGITSATTPQYKRTNADSSWVSVEQIIKQNNGRTKSDADKGHAIANNVDVAAHNPAGSNRKPSLVPTHDSAVQGKERQGFFRRVFGSSRNASPVSTDTVSSQLNQASRESARADSRAGQNPPLPAERIARAPSANETYFNPPKDLPPLPLNKKTSFFRRRKKSISGDVLIPIIPLDIQSEMRNPFSVQATESSPVSSLRKVMDPYLNSPVTSQHNRDELVSGESGKYDRSYLAGYAARNESTRRSGLGSSHSNKNLAIVGTPQDPGLPIARREIPNGLVQSSPSLRPNEDASYLLDSSGTEGLLDSPTPVSPPKSALSVAHMEQLGKTGPPPLGSARDLITANKENERPADRFTRTNSQPDRDVKMPSAKISPQPLRKGSIPESRFEPRTQRVNLEEWYAAPQPSPIMETPKSKDSSHYSTRIFLQPTASEEALNEPETLSIPLDTVPASVQASESSVSENKSVSSVIPSPTIEYLPEAQELPVEADFDEELSEIDTNHPNDSERLQAKIIFDGDDPELDKSKAAPWLGEVTPERARVRRAYMELFDWQNLNILAALRILCGKLFLKGETQQVDRILDAFSTRWCTCNPNHGFKATDVVHTICYSILLLNTDLHMVGIDQKMTRTQFIKNTMPTIRRVAADAAPDGFETVRNSVMPAPRGQVSLTAPTSPNLKATTISTESRDRRPSVDDRRPIKRLSSRPSDHSDQVIVSSAQFTTLDYETPNDDCGPLVKAPFFGRLGTWEVQVEIVLKEFYNSIRQRRLPLHGSDDIDRVPEPTHSSNSLSALTGTMLRRTPSMLSKAGSDHQTMRGRLQEVRSGSSRWASKNRSRPRLYPASGLHSSRTSLDDQSSVISPYASSTWSKYSFGKTQNSMSVDSLASNYPQGDYKQSIGFANALSQAIIREEGAVGDKTEESLHVAPLLEDESLELAGAPWAKEGILKHKHHLESADKKAKDRNWMECFAVVEKGWMRLFQFNMNAKSMRQKMKNQKAVGGVVGGGNWTENAEALGKFLLRQTIASALPPPGYSKTGPHVWALSLPTGAVHLFQAGTPDIVKEFVTTVNYWSARLSKEPLIGGVSNIEYGWSDAVINTALLPVDNRPPLTNAAGRRPSLQSSIRSSMDQGSVKPKLPGDRIVISDWTPPQQSMMASALMEVDQLKGLTAYVKNIEEDFQKHNELRSVMLLTVSHVMSEYLPITRRTKLKAVLPPPSQSHQSNGELGT